ncbi:unnamed protein product, partial [Allacma fusca]
MKMFKSFEGSFQGYKTVRSEAQDPIISKRLKSVIKVLNYCGTCPVSCNENKKGFFEFVWSSKSTLVCLVAVVWINLVLVVYIADVFFQIHPYSTYTLILERLWKAVSSNPNITYSQAELFHRLAISVYFILVVSVLHGMINGWLEAPNLAKFLNNWKKLHVQIDRNFQAFLQVRSLPPQNNTQSSRILLIYFMPLVAIGLISAIMNPAMNSTISVNLMRGLIGFTVLASTVSGELLDDAKINGMLESCAKAYQV